MTCTVARIFYRVIDSTRCQKRSMGTLIYTDLATCILQFLSRCKKLCRLHFTAPFRGAGKKGWWGATSQQSTFSSATSRDNDSLCCQKKGKVSRKGCTWSATCMHAVFGDAGISGNNRSLQARGNLPLSVKPHLFH